MHSTGAESREAFRHKTTEPFKLGTLSLGNKQAFLNKVKASHERKAIKRFMMRLHIALPTRNAKGWLVALHWFFQIQEHLNQG